MSANSVGDDAILNLVGKKMRPSSWSKITQQQVNQFADCTDDHQFIHTDPEKAAQSPFGGTIAHGFLTLSMLTKMCSENAIMQGDIVMGVNYGFDKVRFLAPVKVGGEIRAHVEILDVEKKEEKKYLVKQGISIEIKGEETPALVAEWLGLIVIA